MRRHLTSLLSSFRATFPSGDAAAQIAQGLEDGLRCYHDGDIATAIQLLSKVADTEPDNVEASFLLGRLYGQQCEYDTALQLLEKTVLLQPDHAAAWNSLANVYRLQGRPEEAIKSYRRSIAIDPRATAAYMNLARVLLGFERCEEAIAAIDALVAFEQRAPEAYYLRGSVYRRLGQQERAIGDFFRARDLAPRNAAALESLTETLLVCSRFEQALRVAQEAVQRDPQWAVAHGCLGSVLLKMDRLEKALQSLEHALALEPNSHVTLRNKGIALQYLGRLKAARESYDQALVIKPDHDYTRYLRSMVHLLAGDYTRGWTDYEYRREVRSPRRSFPYPRWDGGPLDGRSILVYAEQGLGDEIMFASCLPDLIAGQGRFVVDCSPKLAALFARSFPAALVRGHTQTQPTDWVAELEPIDVCIPAGSLPSHFRRSRAEFPRHQGYLHADSEQVARWRSRLTDLGVGMKVGISWRGGSEKTHSRRRSIELTQWLPLLVQPGIQFVSLQYTDCRRELEDLEAAHGVKVHHWQDAIDDYDQTAALTTALDLVISVQTAIVHLCGALNKPAWALVSASPEWRYGWSGGSIPWYPSVRLFRQRRLGEWDDVMRDVVDELGRLREYA